MPGIRRRTNHKIICRPSAPPCMACFVRNDKIIHRQSSVYRFFSQLLSYELTGCFFCQGRGNCGHLKLQFWNLTTLSAGCSQDNSETMPASFLVTCKVRLYFWLQAFQRFFSIWLETNCKSVCINAHTFWHDFSSFF